MGLSDVLTRMEIARRKKLATAKNNRVKVIANSNADQIQRIKHQLRYATGDDRAELQTALDKLEQR